MLVCQGKGFMYTLADVSRILMPGVAVDEIGQIRIEGVCIDSRQAKPGELFVALHGERVDGHAFVGQAFQAGAVAALVEHSIPGWMLIDTVEDGAV